MQQQQKKTHKICYKYKKQPRCWWLKLHEKCASEFKTKIEPNTNLFYYNLNEQSLADLMASLINVTFAFSRHFKRKPCDTNIYICWIT